MWFDMERAKYFDWLVAFVVRVKRHFEHKLDKDDRRLQLIQCNILIAPIASLFLSCILHHCSQTNCKCNSQFANAISISISIENN